jgi:tripartite-type tricarboxylate transporter receptor subunit TctC
MRRALQLIGAALAALAAGWTPAFAQTFPTRSITLIVPFAPGGPTDTVARLAGEHMSRSLGQPIVIENTPGAAGVTAAMRLIGSPPDGYTLLMGTIGTHAAAVALSPGLRYRPTEDFAPIGLVNTNPMFLAVRSSHPAGTLPEFVAWLKANEGRANYGHAGIGSPSHMSCLIFNAAAGVKPAGIAYRGLAPAMNDLVGNQIDYICDQAVSVASHHRARTVKVLAVAARERSAAMPDVATSVEGGLPGFEVTVWNALFAPKGTPDAAVARLTLALQAALADAGVRRRLEDVGAAVPALDRQAPAGLRAFVADEIERWTPVIRAAGVTLQ